jgi:hypothetical protein
MHTSVWILPFSKQSTRGAEWLFQAHALKATFGKGVGGERLLPFTPFFRFRMWRRRNTKIVNFPLLARLEKNYEKYASFWELQNTGRSGFSIFSCFAPCFAKLGRHKE